MNNRVKLIVRRAYGFHSAYFLPYRKESGLMTAIDLAALAAGRAPKPPGGVVIARLRDGAVEVAGAGGVAPDAVFELGSITKTVTGLLLADAVVRGEVELDTTSTPASRGRERLHSRISRRTPPGCRACR